jgi:hypothetical protein
LAGIVYVVTIQATQNMPWLEKLEFTGIAALALLIVGFGVPRLRHRLISTVKVFVFR